MKLLYQKEAFIIHNWSSFTYRFLNILPKYFWNYFMNFFVQILLELTLFFFCCPFLSARKRFCDNVERSETKYVFNAEREIPSRRFILSRIKEYQRFCSTDNVPTETTVISEKWAEVDWSNYPSFHIRRWDRCAVIR